MTVIRFLMSSGNFGNTRNLVQSLTWVRPAP